MSYLLPRNGEEAIQLIGLFTLIILLTILLSAVGSCITANRHVEYYYIGSNMDDGYAVMGFVDWSEDDNIINVDDFHEASAMVDSLNSLLKRK